MSAIAIQSPIVSTHQMKREPSKELKPKKIVAPFWVTFVAGAMSGTTGAIVTNPLEVVKTRMQASNFTPLSKAVNKNIPGVVWSQIKGTCGVLSSIYTQEGLRALWRGTGATLLGVMPSRAIYFSTYAWAKKTIASSFNDGNDSLWWIHLPAAMTAGVVVSTATNPLWLIKTKMQLQGTLPDGTPALYRSSLDCVRHVIRTDGVQGLYKGMTASYLGAIEGTIHWVLYEKLKSTFASLRAVNMQNDDNSIIDQSKTLQWSDYLVAAGVSKLTAAVALYPHEVIRTRLREEGGRYKGLYRTARLVIAEEGAGALYFGLTAHLMRTVPNSAIMFFTYECLMLAHKYLSSTTDT